MRKERKAEEGMTLEFIDSSIQNLQAETKRELDIEVPEEEEVALPDGRLQKVNYNVADAYTGYVADVVYTGEAVYPAYSKPAYAPAPYKA